MTRPVLRTVQDEIAVGRRYARVEGILIGLLLGALLGGVFNYMDQQTDVSDPRMEKACSWPKRPGASLMVGIDGEGKQHCWRND